MLGIFLDLETTGLDPFHHRVLDLACVLVDLVSGEEKACYQSLIRQPQNVWAEQDPASQAIHGLTFESVEGGKSEEAVRKEILSLFTAFGVCRSSALFICQNPSFDRGFFAQIVDPYTQESLHWPYHWLDLASMYWVKKMEELRQREKKLVALPALSKNAIAAHFGLPPEPLPHAAINGVRHLLLCYSKTVGFFPSYDRTP